MRPGLVVLSVLAMGFAQMAGALPNYRVKQVFIPNDQTPVEGSQKQGPLYKPHDVALRRTGTNIWVSSNERAGFGGITIFKAPRNEVLATLNIDEPGVEFHTSTEEEEAAESGTATDTTVEEQEDTTDENFPPEVRLNPSVCLPVMLPPNASVPQLDGTPVKVDPSDPHRICAPLGAEMHARHPHGIDIDKVRARAYQVIEHSGLKWNADRSGFEVAENVDEEAGMLLVYNISNPNKPAIYDGYLLGHGPHEAAVNERNGHVFVGNHEDSPGVTPSVWLSVIRRGKPDPYGFIDTGWGNAIQGIEVDEPLNVAFGTTHVGEKMFAFDANCAGATRRNANPTDEKQMGEKCILYSVDIRRPFMEQISDARSVFALAQAFADEECQPAVLHMHDLAVDNVDHRVYMTIHSIHHAEHTGSPEETACHEAQEAAEAEEQAAAEETTTTEEEAAAAEEEEEAGHHFMGRWVAKVYVNPDQDGFKQVKFIDLSNGQNVMDVPNVDEIPADTPLEQRFVHAHWVDVDPVRNAVLVSGEHTGNLAVVHSGNLKPKQYLGISQLMPDATPGDEEPHVHGVRIEPVSGRVYVSDEGESEHYFESVTVLVPR
jgi:hypothetical protein